MTRARFVEKTSPTLQGHINALALSYAALIDSRGLAWQDRFRSTSTPR
jgi:hypothetical protein